MYPEEKKERNQKLHSCIKIKGGNVLFNATFLPSFLPNNYKSTVKCTDRPVNFLISFRQVKCGKILEPLVIPVVWDWWEEVGQ